MEVKELSLLIEKKVLQTQHAGIQEQKRNTNVDTIANN